MTVPHHDLNFAEGEVLLVDKPAGWTSFDVVNKIRCLFHVPKVGHAGTLDPMATGLLIVCTGRKTKEIAGFTGLDKEYDAEMTLGGRTASYDAETPIIEAKSLEGITEPLIRDVLARFVGAQMQIPPMWSALKVGGRRLHTLARRGIEIDRAPRAVTIHEITPTAIDLPKVRFTVVCTKGTYVRSLVNDIGGFLGCGAYLSGLIRTRIGDFHLSDALSVNDLIEYQTMRRTTPA